MMKPISTSGYKPNTTRTDIGVVSSGGDPVYAQSTLHRKRSRLSLVSVNLLMLDTTL